MTDDAAATAPGRQRRAIQSAGNVVVTVATALFFALALQAFAVKPYRIPSASMQPTLMIGDRVLVNRFAHRVLEEAPHVGQVVVFHPPRGVDYPTTRCGSPITGAGSLTPCDRPTPTRSAQNFIKRVVGVGGDTIAVQDGHVIRNGKLQREPFAARCRPGGNCDFPLPMTVPLGHVFLMGDNRGNSDDSRFWGPVPNAWVVGEAFASYWPMGRAGGL